MTGDRKTDRQTDTHTHTDGLVYKVFKFAQDVEYKKRQKITTLIILKSSLSNKRSSQVNFPCVFHLYVYLIKSHKWHNVMQDFTQKINYKFVFTRLNSLLIVCQGVAATYNGSVTMAFQLGSPVIKIYHTTVHLH